MRTSIIVDDNTVYTRGKAVAVDLSSLASRGIRAVQWQERALGIGHVEFVDSPNAPLDAESFADLCGDIVAVANQLIDEYEAGGPGGSVPEPTLEEAKASKRRQIDAQRDQQIDSGVSFAGHVFDSDQRSRDNLTGAVSAFSAGVPIPEGFTWRSADNQNIPVGMPELLGLSGAMLLHVNAAYSTAWARKAAVDAAQTFEELETI